MATKTREQGNLTRRCQAFSSVACATAIANSDVLPMFEYAYGSVTASSTETAVLLTVYGVNGSSTGSPYALYDQDGVASTITIAASRCTELPAEVAGCEYIAFKADAAASPRVVLKS